MGKLFRTSWLVLVVALAGTGAQARSSHQKWLQVRSPHFVVITDGKYSQARDVAEHFERIREVFLKMSPTMHVDTPEPVVILAVKNGGDLKKLLPGFWEQKGRMHPAGLFVSGQDRNYVALRMDANSEESYHVVYHEYVHVLESLNFSSLPLWVSEGLAEFYAAARIDGKDVGLGYPIGAHLALLQEGRWVPLPKLLTADHSSPLYNENNLSSIFYAESWELTHYLLTSNNGSLQPEFMKYIQLFEKGVPSLTAAEETFGDLHKLDDKLASYSRQRVFNYLRVKTSIGGGKAAYPSQTLATAQVDAVIGDFYVRTNRPAEAGKTLQEAIRLDPRLPGPYASLGLLALRQRNQAAALKWLGQAVALGSKDYVVYYYHANLLLNREGRLGEQQAIGEMNRCIELNANFADGYRLLAQLYGLRDEKLGLASSLVLRAIELKPKASRNYLTLGLVRMRQGKAGQAETAGKKALALASSDGDRRRAQDFLDQVRQWREEVASGAQVGGPILVTRPSASESGTAQQPTASGGPVPAGSSNTIVAPPGGFTMVANGKALRARCSGKTLTFLLMINGSGVPLFAADKSSVQYKGFPSTAAKSPCSFLDGRRVVVRFLVVHGKPYFGKILEIDYGHIH